MGPWLRHRALRDSASLRPFGLACSHRSNPLSSPVWVIVRPVVDNFVNIE
ncbi:MAG: hypothetical protein PQJ59_18680 [Spirochaetales bacterium]|nr:hypothetical protein [Spirochaetales bacterium]